MAGAAPVPAGKGRRKSLDAAINLVPFIDLLSCCISFLLITAVWTQLGRVDVSQPGEGTDERAEAREPPLMLDVTPDGLWLRSATGALTEIPVTNGDYDYPRLTAALTAARSASATTLSIRAHDTIRYERLIHLIDLAHGAQIADVGLVDLPAGG